MTHWLPHLWLPALVFILLFALFKMPTAVRLPTSSHALQISLQIPTPDNKSIENLSSTTNPLPNPRTKPDKPIQPAEPVKPIIEPTEEPQPTPDIITQQTKTTKPQETKVTVSATDLIQQAKTHTNVQISDEFTARTNNKKNETPWNTIPTAQGPYADVPYLATYDLAVDMNFYSEGYRGDIERFFDAVILKKTFTTKYGTKISCALAVLLVCSWK
ncbi:MAG: hypothetical protein OQK49_00725 [Proteobacteria bacterium]|nr:hypothetical protein [Pseudomonadota bacterium]